MLGKFISNSDYILLLHEKRFVTLKNFTKYNVLYQ